MKGGKCGTSDSDGGKDGREKQKSSLTPHHCDGDAEGGRGERERERERERVGRRKKRKVSEEKRLSQTSASSTAPGKDLGEGSKKG